jgi:hypothetical protein
MRKVICFLTFMVTVNMSFAVQQTSELRLATSQLSSKTITLEIQTEQSLREQMECVLSQMNFKPRIETKPWNRIYHDLQRGQLDGFYSAIRRNQLDSFATISVPLIVENWYWFWRPGITAPDSWQEGYRLGSILGSQQEKWLEEAGYKISMTANHLPQLIRMLDRGRVDVILVDREHFLQAVYQSHESAVGYQSRFFRYMPLGAYFSGDFLGRHPGFLQQFNQQTTQCSKRKFSLSENEIKLVTQVVRGMQQQWEKTDNWTVEMRSYGAAQSSYSNAEIKKLDDLWINAFQSGDYRIKDQLTHQDLSRSLQNIKESSDGMVTEIILTDARGLNLAVTDMTSDFYQGDEEKFIKAKALHSGQYFVDNIAYDASTHMFQVNVSYPLFDSSNNNQFLGVMIIGINVEKTLSLLH